MTDENQQPAPAETAPGDTAPTPGPVDTPETPGPAPDVPLFSEPTMEGVQAGLPPQEVLTLDERPPERK
jgi:hypothetical protein